MTMSFLQFSQLTPRERMLVGLRGNLSPTFGLEVGSPRGQLGVIPMAGLGLWRPSGDATVVQEGAVVASAVAAPTVYTAPTTSYVTVDSPLVKLPTSPVNTSALTQPEPSVQVPVEDDTGQSASGDPVDDGGGDPSSGRDELDPGSYAAGTADDREAEFDGDRYDSDGNKQDAWGEGGSDGSAGPFNHDTYNEQHNAIKKPATKAQAMLQTATSYWPWIAGGGALLGLAFFLGRKKR